MSKIETKNGGSLKYTLEGDKLKMSFPGTAGWKDIIHDVLAFGVTRVADYPVALGPALQGREIFYDLKDQVGILTLMRVSEISISGHSLGAGIGMLMPLIWYEQFGAKVDKWSLSFDGPLYTLSERASRFLTTITGNSIECREFRKDPVPGVSGLRWHKPGLVRTAGPKGLWDFDIVSKDSWHQKYWDKDESGKNIWFG